MTNELISKALAILAPSAEWTLSGDDYSKIDWISESTKPTAKQVADTIEQLPALELASIEALLQSKAALLERIGITADEAKLLLS
jgi:hypothetical protein